MEATILNKQAFYEAVKGEIIIDTNGGEWVFAEEPQITPFNIVNPESEPIRKIKSPVGVNYDITYTYAYGAPCLVNEDYLMIPELKVI